MVVEHVSTVRIFNPRIFHMLFLLSKNSLCLWISVYPLEENDFFGNLPQLFWIWYFLDMYLTHLGTRIWRDSFHIYFKKWFFGPSKLCCPLFLQGKKTCFSTLNVTILQLVRNECVRFGGHVDIEVSYKILRLDVLFKTPSLQNPPCFEEGLFWGSFDEKYPQNFRG